MRVTQQHDCYAAEATVPEGRRFRDVAEVQRWVDDLRDNAWWHLQGYSLHVLRIEVGLMNKRQAAKAGGVGWFEKSKNAGRIELRLDMLTERIVLHEVAHVLADAVHGSTCHDPAWARTYLTLVSYVMGPEAYVTLRDAFDARGVDYDAPRPAQSGAIAL